MHFVPIYDIVYCMEDNKRHIKETDQIYRRMKEISMMYRFHVISEDPAHT